MHTRRLLLLTGFVALAIAALPHARPDVTVGPTDIGGVVSGPRGPDTCCVNTSTSPPVGGIAALGAASPAPTAPDAPDAAEVGAVKTKVPSGPATQRVSTPEPFVDVPP